MEASRPGAHHRRRSRGVIAVRGAHQNNLKGLDLDLPLGELIVVTGVSGSGKSSLAFDTVYAEGQRRYVETFSPYARQFLERMDRPRVDRIDGIPPAVSVDQTNQVRTSRSTVGTMTEINDYLKLLYPRLARLHCRGCGEEVRRDTPESIADRLLAEMPEERIVVRFRIPVPANFSAEEVRRHLARQGYTRVAEVEPAELEVTQDRVRPRSAGRARLVEALEAALAAGRGRAEVATGDAVRRFSSELECPRCEILYRDPTPGSFSFNSPIGACDTCRGFGRTMGIDYGLVVPDESRSLRQGAIKPLQTLTYAPYQRYLLSQAERAGVPADTPWRELSAEQRAWVIEGDGRRRDDRWFGLEGFFRWLERKSYRMHIRVLLSRYRAYLRCEACGGARLKADALDWKLGAAHLDIHELCTLPFARCLAFFDELREQTDGLDEATAFLVDEVRSRLRYLVEVGLGYLTLDRQSRSLSGGEVQRINLTTALGTSLVNTLFVLDEPSVGLHARDLDRMIGVLRRLRDAGNTLLVVEHDAQVIRAADRVIDLGPGPGAAGGGVVFEGSPRALARSRRSLTGAYLGGRRRVEAASASGATPGGHDGPGDRALLIRGAAEHNLKTIDVRLPLGRLVCVTGVSGSGKSTLVEDICYRGLSRTLGRPCETPGRHDGIEGAADLEDVVLVDQSPIGKTTRSNPASYTGALAPIRKLFAMEPLARERSYTAGRFSFNSGDGRCPTCSGNGFEHIEMQFLSDVYLRCPDCDGRRFRPEVLEVKLAPDGLSIADVLDLTIDEAVERFEGHADILAGLEPLRAVGLGYLALGQPVPSLSGGEAQRLKLAGHLATTHRGGRSGHSRTRGAGSGRTAERAPGTGTLFLFDEPTTGLHFDDVATLLGAFRALVAAGHSVVVIEHHLDVIASADWIVDLGPEGGDAGGEIVCEGSPGAVAAHPASHTGRELKAHFAALARCDAGAAENDGAAAGTTGDAPSVREAPARYAAPEAIEVRRARDHNLKNIDVLLPRDRFTVITGVSGSGKSTLAFDIVFAEGQRRYLESLNAYARQFVQPAARPDVDAILGIPPTVAIEQRTSQGGAKSTVATLTEVHHFLRLLYVKLGTQYCPDCERPIEPQSRAAIAAGVLRKFRGRTIELLAPVVVARKGYYTELARWAARKGYSHLRVDGAAVPTGAWPRLDRYREHDIELPVATLTVAPGAESRLESALDTALELGRSAVIVAERGGAGREEAYSTSRACSGCGRSFGELDPRMFSFNSRHGRCASCQGSGREPARAARRHRAKRRGGRGDRRPNDTWTVADYEREEQLPASAVPCAVCGGDRLRPEARAVRFRDRSIGDLGRLSIEEARAWAEGLELDDREGAIAGDLLAELRARLDFLNQVGLGYLALERSAPSLSGGEAQRIRLAAQLGSNLRGVCYVLDEPTIGLHARDNARLLDALERLRTNGNTVVVVEHDEATIRRAEHVVDLGPGAGAEGGEVVVAGNLEKIMRTEGSATGQWLAQPPPPIRGTRPVRLGGDDQAWLEVRRARRHNLKRISPRFPLGRLVCVTGVSGSGKSTLVRNVLRESLEEGLAATRTRIERGAGNGGGGENDGASPNGGGGDGAATGCESLLGLHHVSRVLEVDQSPIGKTPRSSPVTYLKIWDHVRRLFAETTEARLRGWSASRFSFNTAERAGGGRCPSCQGQGERRVEMSFLPNARVPCEDCGGARFTRETLAVRFRGRHIGDVLRMTVDEAVDFFRAHPKVHHALLLLREVGLGYLRLGQQSPSLSGGEAQRLKLVTELAKARPAEESPRARRNHTVYLLDEPTVGLHMADVEKLVRVLHRLAASGHTVIVIEHNLDVIAAADWIIDLGPEGGAEGGWIVAEGTPEQVARIQPAGHTGQVLAEFLETREAVA